MKGELVCFDCGDRSYSRADFFRERRDQRQDPWSLFTMDYLNGNVGEKWYCAYCHIRLLSRRRRNFVRNEREMQCDYCGYTWPVPAQIEAGKQLLSRLQQSLQDPANLAHPEALKAIQRDIERCRRWLNQIEALSRSDLSRSWECCNCLTLVGWCQSLAESRQAYPLTVDLYKKLHLLRPTKGFSGKPLQPSEDPWPFLDPNEWEAFKIDSDRWGYERRKPRR